MSAEAVVCGEAMLLMLAEPGIPLEHARSFRRSIAGAESNVAAGLARLGHSVRWLGRVGDDPAGRTVLAQLRAEGVDCAYAVTDPGAPTGVLIRDSHPARAIDVQYLRTGSAASRLSPDELTPAMFEGARLVHITGITPMLSESARRATLCLFARARAAGARLSFDPNIRHKLGPPDRWREVVGPLLVGADVVLAGEDELELLGVTSPAALLESGPGTVVVKHRDKSASCLTRGAPDCRQPAFEVPVADPVGAGDAFAAGFLSGLLHGSDPAQCLRRAAAVAALVVQCPTDTDGLPDRAGLDRALAARTDAGAEAVIR
ncbi:MULTISPECIES: sugar kinase [unclassified Streptomyces]|uniref:sugar kinase n=1 Tax=unclassified Streptomyces TaxID=2593676 RepID=UPI002DDA6C67|nr:sugar kinase [Streptomyces sp. NBC_01257]WRZ68326.1 sugar kinase [Streptomyces sp. NBC_01257]WSU62275.1 sugar kinase [Streptomyces sp. NBC_01104]